MARLSSRLWVARSTSSASRGRAAWSRPRRPNIMPKRSWAATSRWVSPRILSASCQLQKSELTKSSSSSPGAKGRSEEHTSELQSQFHLVCRLLLEKKKKQQKKNTPNNKTKQKDKKNN